MILSHGPKPVNEGLSARDVKRTPVSRAGQPQLFALSRLECRLRTVLRPWLKPLLVDMMVRAGLIERWLGKMVSWTRGRPPTGKFESRRTDGCGLK
jgi:hypothetical protein